jgi:hypothetical protein
MVGDRQHGAMGWSFPGLFWPWAVTPDDVNGVHDYVVL